MQDIRITLVQSNTFWHDFAENTLMLEKIFREQLEDTDVVVLPEMFNTGFSMNSSELAENMNGPTHLWMKEMAKLYDIALCGSIIIREDNAYFNRFLWVEPTGKTISYDKRHLFRMADEHLHFKEGEQMVTIEYKNWRIRPLICYDLRFPVWTRNKIEGTVYDYDILLFVANWPAQRVVAWDSLLKARAIENHAYCVGVNRIGIDGNSIEYNGHSAIYDPRGATICSMLNNEAVETRSLNKSLLDEYRAKFPAQLDADQFKINCRT